ncbi:MAG: CBS domain-containing protein [Chromatiales bacterium]
MTVDLLVADGRVSFESAVAHVCVKVPRASPGDRAEDLLRAVLGREFESASHIIVCEGDNFLGILRIEALLAAPGDAPVASLMDREAPVVRPGVDQEVAAWHAVRHGESALPVVDREGRFVGIIPPHRLLAVLLSEHEEDLSRLGGFLKSTSAARATSEEPVERRFRHRLPWLFVGLAGALLAADFVGWFEAQLQQKVMLAFFIPGIVYLAQPSATDPHSSSIPCFNSDKVCIAVTSKNGRRHRAKIRRGAGFVSSP